MKKWILTLFVGWAGATSLRAQLNESDTISWQLKYNSTATVIQGNFSRTLLLNRLEFAHASPQWGLSTRTDYQYGRTFKRQTEDDWVSYNFLYLKPMAKVYPYVMGLAETNLRRLIDFRYQVGPGITWNAHRSEKSILKLSLTGTYENTNFNGSSYNEASYDGKEVVDTWRVTGRFFGKLTLRNIRLSGEFWWQQSVVDATNYRFHTEEAVEWPITKKIALRTVLRYSYERIAIVSLKNYDLFFTYGLSISNF